MFRTHLDREIIVRARKAGQSVLRGVFKKIADIDLQHLCRGENSRGVPIDRWYCARELPQFLSGSLDGFDSRIYFFQFSSVH